MIFHTSFGLIDQQLINYQQIFILYFLIPKNGRGLSLGHIYDEKMSKYVRNIK